MKKPNDDFKMLVLGLFGWIFIVIISLMLLTRCVSYMDRPLAKPSQEQLEPQEGDDELITKEDGIDVGMLREALKAKADVEMLEGNAQEDKDYYVNIIDEANQRIVAISIGASVVMVIILLIK